MLLLTGSALASSNNVSTSSDVGILFVDQNSTEKSSLFLSPTPMSVIKTKVDVSEIPYGIWRASDRVSAIAAWITIITFVGSIIFFAYKWQKTKKNRT